MPPAQLHVFARPQLAKEIKLLLRDQVLLVAVEELVRFHELRPLPAERSLRLPRADWWRDYYSRELAGDLGSDQVLVSSITYRDREVVSYLDRAHRKLGWPKECFDIRHSSQAMVSAVKEALGEYSLKSVEASLKSMRNRSHAGNVSVLEWLRQWDSLGLRHVGEEVLRSVKTVETVELCGRWTFPSDQKTQIGDKPCYVVFDSRESDSDGLVKDILTNMGHSVVPLFRNRDAAIAAGCIAKDQEGKEIDLTNGGFVSLIHSEQIETSTSLVMLDECSFTGKKLAGDLVVLCEIAKHFGKTVFLKFAYCAADGKPDSFPEGVKWLEVNEPGNLMADFSEDKPMVFAHLPDDTRDRYLEIIKTLGGQLMLRDPANGNDPDHALGMGNLGSTLLFEILIPGNTIPVLRMRGTVEYQGKRVEWKPLVVRKPYRQKSPT
jgi:hypothetical protein